MKRILLYLKLFCEHYSISRDRHHRGFVKKTIIDSLKDAYFITNISIKLVK